MKNLRIFLLAAVAVVAGLFSACNNKGFEPGPGVDGAQVYFPEYTPSSYSIGDEVSSIAIPVKRIATNAAQTIDILSDDKESGLFTIPSSVTFAAGEALSNLVITFDRKTLQDGKEYPISFMINSEGNTTPYGNRTLDIVVEPWPWELIQENGGIGKFRDDWFVIGFNGNSPEIEVKMHKHKTKAGLYMIEDMFGWNFLTEFFGQPKAELEADFKYVPTNITVDCTDPAAVVIGKQFSGISFPGSDQYGEISIGTFNKGKLENGVITFPKNGLAFIVNAGNMPANKDGMFRIILPGFEAVDYSLAAAYGGVKVAPDNETASAVLDFTYGADVTNIHYVLAAGDLTDAQIATLITGIADETAENILKFEEFTIGGSKVSAEIAGLAKGNYTLVALPVNKAQAPVAGEASAAVFYFPGAGGAVPANDIAGNLYKVSAYPDAAEFVSKYPDYSSFVYEITGTEMKTIKTYLHKTSVIENIEIATGGMTLQQAMDQYGRALGAEAMKDMAEKGKCWDIFIDVQSGTSYTLVVEAENIYGKKKLIKIAPITTTVPPYTGELVIGSYKMSHQADATTLFENRFEIVPVVGSSTKFFVKDFAMEDDTQWYATYDSSAATLTLDGVQLGREKDKNLFGKFTEGLDAAGNTGYGIFSYATAESKEGNDPLVLAVDPTSKQIKALNGLVEVPVADFTAGKIIGALAVYAKGTVVTKQSAAASAFIPTQKYAPVKVPYRRVSALDIHKQINSDLRSVAQNVKTSAAPSNGVRTLNVKAQKCEPLPKQAGRTASLPENANRPLAK